MVYTLRVFIKDVYFSPQKRHGQELTYHHNPNNPKTPKVKQNGKVGTFKIYVRQSVNFG